MNKQNFFGLLAVVMIAAVAALNVSLNSQKETLSDLAMENVEALADESDDGSIKSCHNKIEVSALHQVFYCGTCDYVKNSIASDQWSLGTCITD